MRRLLNEDGEDGEATPRYAVIISDRADADVRSAHRWLQENVSPEYGDRWYDVEARRMLYSGPSQRRGRNGSVYRVLFHVIAPTEDDPEGVVIGRASGKR